MHDLSLTILKEAPSEVEWEKNASPNELKEFSEGIINYLTKPTIFDWKKVYGSDFEGKVWFESWVRKIKKPGALHYIGEILKDIEEADPVKEQEFISDAKNVLNTDIIPIVALIDFGQIREREFSKIVGMNLRDGKKLFNEIKLFIARRRVRSEIVTKHEIEKSYIDGLIKDLERLGVEKKSETTVERLMTKGDDTIVIPVKPKEHPGKMIKQELIKQQGLRGNFVAEKIGVSGTYFSNILTGKKPITLPVAMGLEAKFNFRSAEELFCLQAAYDVSQEKRTRKKISTKKSLPTSPVVS